MKSLFYPAVLASALFAPSAHAVEGQHHLGLGPSLAVLAIDQKQTADVGVGGAIHYAYGLNDQWNLVAEAGSALVAADQKQDLPTSPHDRPAGVDHASVGVGYVIDILRWVPYLTATATMFRLSGGTLDSALFLPGASVGLGLDYQLSRTFAIGVGVREHFMLTKLSTYPSYTTGTLRFEVMWGY